MKIFSLLTGTLLTTLLIVGLWQVAGYLTYITIGLLLIWAVIEMSL